MGWLRLAARPGRELHPGRGVASSVGSVRRAGPASLALTPWASGLGAKGDATGRDGAAAASET